jgi:hypothetical protein
MLAVEGRRASHLDLLVQCVTGLRRYILRAKRHCWVALVPPMTLVVPIYYCSTVDVPYHSSPARLKGDRPGPKRQDRWFDAAIQPVVMHRSFQWTPPRPGRFMGHLTYGAPFHHQPSTCPVHPHTHANVHQPTSVICTCPVLVPSPLLWHMYKCMCSTEYGVLQHLIQKYSVRSKYSPHHDQSTAYQA